MASSPRIGISLGGNSMRFRWHWFIWMIHSNKVSLSSQGRSGTGTDTGIHGQDKKDHNRLEADGVVRTGHHVVSLLV